MGRSGSIQFGPFRLDLDAGRLLRGAERIDLRPKTWEVLCYLAEHPGALIGKQVLLDAVWGDVAITEGTLAKSIQELRDGLGDDAHEPRYIETVHRRGYRFIGHEGADPTATASAPTVPTIVGREAELEWLRGRLDAAMRGERQVVFVSGEAGIGKTTLLEAFLALADSGAVAIARGQCIEQHGPAEPYLPVFEAITRLCSGSGGDAAIEVLRGIAPNWLAQLALGDGAAPAPTPAIARAGQEHLLTQMAAALDAIASRRPLVLMFEDLHWSDASTVDLIAAIARRRDRACLLLLGTLRPVDAIVTEHPIMRLQAELVRKREAHDLPLELLGEAAVTAYLDQRFSEHAFPAALARVVYERTDGNPFFVVSVIDHLVERRWVAQRDGGWSLTVEPDAVRGIVPDGLRAMIERQLDDLELSTYQVLEAASVAGAEFCAQSVAAATAQSVEAVEDACDALSRRRHLLCARGDAEWPDHSAGGQYAFTHALYPRVLYDRMPSARRVRLHKRIGERLAAGYRRRSAEIASQLADHFELGRDRARAFEYREQAATTAVRRCAYPEAVAHLRKALTLLPDGPAGEEAELRVQIALGEALMNARGWGDAEGGAAFARARALCGRSDVPPQRFLSLAGLASFYQLRADFGAAAAVGDEMLALAERFPLPPFIVGAHAVRAQTHLVVGELLQARAHFEASLAAADADMPAAAAHLEVMARTGLGTTLCLLGHADEARAATNAALARAAEIALPYVTATAQHLSAVQHAVHRQVADARRCAEAARELGLRHGLGHWIGAPNVVRGWSMAMEGDANGLAQIREGLAGHAAIGARAYLCFMGIFLADACLAVGEIDTGLAAVADALDRVEKTGERFAEAELWRLRGELHARAHAPAQRGRKRRADATAAEDEACFERAVTIARAQAAKLWELRATMSLARRRLERGRPAEARALLQPLLPWFDGRGGSDVIAAQRLLASCA